MKRNPRLLLPILSILLTLACLGSPEPTTQPVSNATSLPSPSTAPTPTVMPAQFPGLKIAYILDGNIWFWDGGAPARQLTSDGDATQVKIADDGIVIAYQRGQSLWAINADGSSPRLLVGLVSYVIPILHPQGKGLINLDYYEFQPGTHWVYFNTNWTGEGINIPSNDLHRVNTDSPSPQVLLTQGSGGFIFSPDGNLLALTSESNINIVHADGSELITVLTFPFVSRWFFFKPQVVWLSNGTGFYTVIPGNDEEKDKYLFVSSEGGLSAQLAEFDAVTFESIPEISPDGLKVAYVIQNKTAEELHVIEASNVDTIIASYPETSMLTPWNWSPDSKRVTFSIADSSSLFTTEIGIPPSPLAESVTPYSLRWVSADRFIFFREGELLIGQINNPETISIASGFANDQLDTKHYDFTLNPPP
jgi:hypothetical protein